MTVIVEKPYWLWDGPKPCEHEVCQRSGTPMCEYTGMSWGQTEEMMSQPHSLFLCNGRCSDPFHTKHVIQTAWANEFGYGWGDLAMIWDAEEEALETPEQIAAKDAAKVAREAQEKLDNEASKMAAYACHRGMMNSNKHGIKKVARPCKNLYYTHDGKKTVRVSSECWAYEYTDPKTKRFEKPHTCEHLHPGENGWLKEWFTDRNFGSIPKGGNDRFAALGGFSKGGFGKGGGGGHR